MASQLDLLKQDLARLQADGKDGLFVQGLKAQIARLEKPLAENPTQTSSVGIRPKPTPSK